MRTQANRLATALCLTALLLAAIFPPTTCLADDALVLSQRIMAEDAAAGDLYGFSQATDGHWLAVGAKFADTFAGGPAPGRRVRPEPGHGSNPWWLAVRGRRPIRPGRARKRRGALLLHAGERSALMPWFSTRRDLISGGQGRLSGGGSE